MDHESHHQGLAKRLNLHFEKYWYVSRLEVASAPLLFWPLLLLPMPVAAKTASKPSNSFLRFSLRPKSEAWFSLAMVANLVLWTVPVALEDVMMAEAAEVTVTELEVTVDIAWASSAEVTLGSILTLFGSLIMSFRCWCYADQSVVVLNEWIKRERRCFRLSVGFDICHHCRADPKLSGFEFLE